MGTLGYQPKDEPEEVRLRRQNRKIVIGLLIVIALGWGIRATYREVSRRVNNWWTRRQFTAWRDALVAGPMTTSVDQTLPSGMTPPPELSKLGKLEILQSEILDDNTIVVFCIDERLSTERPVAYFRNLHRLDIHERSVGDQVTIQITEARWPLTMSGQPTTITVRHDGGILKLTLHEPEAPDRSLAMNMEQLRTAPGRPQAIAVLARDDLDRPTHHDIPDLIWALATP